MIDIVIPVLNEETILKEKQQYYSQLSTKANLIFVDGGSNDRTQELAENYGQVVTTRPGRAFQKNFGAKRSNSDYLLFLHVDSFVDEKALFEAENALGDGTVGGCFTMHIDDPRPIFRVYEKAVNFRAKKFGIVDGDLGMFIRKDVFNKSGAFDQKPIMEDLLYSRKINSKYSLKVLPNMITVSSRKWNDEGFIRTFIKYMLAYVQLWTGLPIFKHKEFHGASI